MVNVVGKALSAGGVLISLAREVGLAMTRIMLAEPVPDGVLVNALYIGLILSEQRKRFLHNDRPEASMDKYVAEQAKAVRFGRIGTSEEFADVSCFPASDFASSVTGMAINVDAGCTPCGEPQKTVSPLRLHAWGLSGKAPSNVYPVASIPSMRLIACLCRKEVSF